MDNCWHFNYYQDESVINELFKLLDNDDRYIDIHIDNGDILTIKKGHEVQVGLGAMMISTYDSIRFINTDKIVQIVLYRSADKQHIISDDSEEEK